MKEGLKIYDQLSRSVIAISIGLLFIIWPESIISWAVLFIGIISLIIGGIQVAVYAASKSKNQEHSQNVPLIGILLVIWGLLLILQPHVWVNLFMIVMSIPMILMAIGQITLLIKKRREGLLVRWTYYIFPVSLIIAGIVVMANPFSTALWLVLFSGLWIAAYGIIELINYFSIRN